MPTDDIASHSIERDYYDEAIKAFDVLEEYKDSAQ